MASLTGSTGRFARRAGLALVCMCMAGAAVAQDTVRVIVGYPPGGSNDIVARLIADPLAKELGANVIVENKPGANGTIGAQTVAHAAPDGNTLLLVSASPLVVAPHAMKVQFDTLRDLAPISRVGDVPEAIGVHPQVPAESLAELLALAEKKDVRMASSGNAGLPHLTIELLDSVSQGRFVHVPYKGGGPAVTDTIGGHVDGVVMDLPALASAFESGRIRPLAVASAERVSFLPDVPTADEQGLKGFQSVNWIGVFAPAGTPQETIDRLHRAIRKVVAQPEVHKNLETSAMIPNTDDSPAEFARFVAAEYERWGKVAREAGITRE